MTDDDDSVLCGCCGGTMMECSCEFGELFAQDLLEGGEPCGPGRYIEWCFAHDCPTGKDSRRTRVSRGTVGPCRGCAAEALLASGKDSRANVPTLPGSSTPDWAMAADKRKRKESK